MVSIRACAVGRVSTFVILLGFSAGAVLGEDQEKKEPVPLEEMVVTATRTNERPFDVPNTVFLLSAEDIRSHLSRTLPESLKETPGVTVQKTGHGQGSPFMRGFTGFRTLLLVDGIRVNNSTFREGPNQYWNTVDPLTLSRLEVIKGPSSVLYGSDAIGGTVNAITRSRDEFGEGFLWDRRVYYRFASAERSHVGRAEVSGSYEERLGFLLGGSFKDFGDLEGGRDIGLQPETNYDEQDGDFKIELPFGPDAGLVLAHQRVSQNDAPRTHRTVYGVSFEGTTVGTDRKLSYDQERELSYVQYHAEDLGGVVNALKASLSYQLQEEEEFRIQQDNSSRRQGFEVGTVGAGLQLESLSPLGTWTYGVEYTHDNVNSFQRRYNADGTLRSIEIQGPVADDAAYDLFGVFVQDEIPIRERLELILGARYSYAAADADKVKDPVTDEQTSLSDDYDAVTGSARVLYHLDEREHWRLFAGVSQGFRAPNLSDLTRLDTARSGELETAAPGLNPEAFISCEIGVKTQYEAVSGQLACFYTDIDDLIVRTPTGNIVDGSNEVTKRNAGDGYVQGVELDASYRFLPQFTVFGSFYWVEGYVDTYPASAPEKRKEPLDLLQPITGSVGLRWDNLARNVWLEAVLALAARQDKLSTRDKADTQRVPPGGTPGYEVLTFRGGWEVRKNLTLSAAVENLTNEDYRYHGSGVNEPGTNVVLSVDWTF